MSQINDGGAAFPSNNVYRAGATHEAEDYITARYAGMTLRDWFAGQALAQGWMCLKDNDAVDYKWNAIHAYRMADAMIAERSKGGEG